MSIKPRVLILIATDNLGGPGKGIFQFIRHADSERYDYFLGNFELFKGETYEFKELANENKFNLVLFRQRFKLDPVMIIDVYRFIKKHKINIIQTHGHKTHIIGFFISLIARIKWVTVAHGWTSENLKIRFYAILERFLMRFSDLAICVSPVLFDTLKKIRKKSRTVLVLNAVDPEEIRVSANDYYKTIRESISAEHVIGVFGRLSPEKGQCILIESVKYINGKINGLKLVIVGEGPEESKLKKQCEAYKLNEVITFAGYQACVGDYIKAVDLVVLPSLSEGLPNIVLEAMALKRPVIATNVGAVKEILRNNENGWVVDRNDHIALAEKIIDFFNMDSKSIEMITINACKTINSAFRPEARANKIVNLYEELLSQ